MKIRPFCIVALMSITLSVSGVASASKANEIKYLSKSEILEISEIKKHQAHVDVDSIEAGDAGDVFWYGTGALMVVLLVGTAVWIQSN